jgi:hypothetical protein
MQSSPLPAPRILDSAEGQYTTAEVVSLIASRINDTASDVVWDFETLATIDLAPPIRSLAEELLGAMAHARNLARQLQTIAS